MFPFAGKRGLKQEMAHADAESQKAVLEALREKRRRPGRRMYCDLFSSTRTWKSSQPEIALRGRRKAALARYSSGMGTQQEVLMAQSEST